MLHSVHMLCSVHLVITPPLFAMGSNILRKLTDEEVGRLPEGQKECIICMELFRSGEDVKWLQCLHVYHSKCIDAALHVKSECPVCKTRVH